MFEESYRTLFFSKPAKLSCRSNNLIITQDKIISIPLKDIENIIIDTPQVSLSSSLLSILAKYKIMLFSCDASHMPNGIFLPYIPHYRASKILGIQLSLTKKVKAILWQKIIKAKIANQIALLDKNPIAKKLELFYKNVKMADLDNDEAKAAVLYFPAIFGKGFMRKDLCVINSALNYGYAIIRSVVARNLVASGFLPAVGIFHKNQFNSFNLADDLMEPYRVFVDSRVLSMDLGNENSFKLEHRIYLANILQAKITLANKTYPLNRAISRSIQSFARAISGDLDALELPIFGENSNGREIYESTSDV